MVTNPVRISEAVNHLSLILPAGHIPTRINQIRVVICEDHTVASPLVPWDFPWTITCGKLRLPVRAHPGMVITHLASQPRSPTTVYSHHTQHRHPGPKLPGSQGYLAHKKTPPLRTLQ